MQRSPEREQFLDDIIEGATFGCACWAQGEVVNGVQIIWDFEDPTERWEVTRETIAKGIGKILNDPEFSVNKEIRKYIYCANIDNDAGDIDAVCADVIVQAGIFGEIVYG